MSGLEELADQASRSPRRSVPPPLRRQGDRWMVLVGLVAVSSWAAGIFLGGKWFSSIGYEPFFVSEFLITAGVLLTLPLWYSGGSFRYRRVVVVACAFVAVMTLQSVLRGLAAEYPSALKSGVLGIYPLLALGCASLVHARPALLETFVRRILPLVPLTYFGLHLAGAEVPAAAFGFYLAVAMAFGTAGAYPGSALLMLSASAGTLLLAATAEKRGPVLAVLVAFLVARVLRPPRARSAVDAIAPLLALAGVAAAVLTVSNTPVKPEDVPVVGGVAGRLAAGFSDRGSEAAANVGIRQAMWDYALRTTTEEHPWIGTGAGHFIEITFYGYDLSTVDTGVHNSFIGYAFYAGYPAAAVVCALFAGALCVSASRARGDSRSAAACAAVAAGVVVCLTNVALETPFLAGPIWVAVAVAIALPPLHRSP